MHIVVFITAADKKQARAIARELVQKKLAACASVAGAVESFFWWKKKIDCAREVLIMVKTKKEKFSALCRAVKAAHSYDVPEIIAVPLCAGHAPYLEWIDGSLG